MLDLTTPVLTLTNWAYCYRGDGYTPPEEMVGILGGDIVNHPRLPPGPVLTSAIIDVTKEDGEYRFHTRSGSVYRLEGPCNPAWEGMFPDATARFFESIEKKLKEQQ